MICRMRKAPKRRGQILMINAVGEVERKNAQSYLTDDNIKRISSAYEKYSDEEGFSKVITVQDAEKNDFSLSIPLYVKQVKEENEIDSVELEVHYEHWKRTSERMRVYYEELTKMITKDGEDDE